MTAGRSGRGARDLQPRWYERVRQSVADRRRGGRLPRTLRRVAAVALLLAAGVIALVPDRAADGERVVAVAVDLPVGARISRADLLLVNAGSVPDGALRDPNQAVGRELASAARRGEIVTDARLADEIGPDPGAGRVAVPVRPADAATVDLLGPGMHVAIILVGENGSPSVLAPDAVVLAVPAAPERGPTDRPIVLSVPADKADQIVASAVAGTIALRFT